MRRPKWNAGKFPPPPPEVEKGQKKTRKVQTSTLSTPDGPFAFFLPLPPSLSLFLLGMWRERSREGGKAPVALNHAVPVTRARTESRALLRARAAIVLRPMSPKFSTQVFWRRVNSALTFSSRSPLKIKIKTGLFLFLFLQLLPFRDGRRAVCPRCVFPPLFFGGTKKSSTSLLATAGGGPPS